MNREKRAMLMGAACRLLLALCAVSLYVGSFPLSLSQIGEILQGGLAGEMPARVFWTLRVPRTAVGLLAGLGLGLAGGCTGSADAGRGRDSRRAGGLLHFRGGHGPAGRGGGIRSEPRP